MAVYMSSVLLNASLEALHRYIGDLNFEISQIPSALITGTIYGVCSILGGLVGGKAGLVVGGGIGYQINNLLLPQIRNVGNMLRELTTDNLRHLFNLLINGIQSTMSAVRSQTENRNLNLIELLEKFGYNSDVRMNIIDTLINFFSGIHGSGFRQVTPQ